MGARRLLRRLLERRRLRDPAHAALFVRHRGDDCIALDLETTGLDPVRDELLTLAAIPVEGRMVRLSRALVLTVRATREFRIDAVRHHRLRPLDVAGGVDRNEALDRLLGLLGNRPILGYAVDFDVAVLDRLLVARHGFHLPNRRIELRDAYLERVRLLDPRRDPDLRFEAILGALAVPVVARHTALGDALSTAIAWLRLTRGTPPR